MATISSQYSPNLIYSKKTTMDHSLGVWNGSFVYHDLFYLNLVQDLTIKDKKNILLSFLLFAIEMVVLTVF